MLILMGACEALPFETSSISGRYLKRFGEWSEHFDDIRCFRGLPNKNGHTFRSESVWVHGMSDRIEGLHCALSVIHHPESSIASNLYSHGALGPTDASY